MSHACSSYSISTTTRSTFLVGTLRQDPRSLSKQRIARSAVGADAGDKGGVGLLVEKLPEVVRKHRDPSMVGLESCLGSRAPQIY